MESFDGNFYVVSLYAHHAHRICTGHDKSFILSYRLKRDWLNRHSYVAICSRPIPWVESFSPDFEGIIGMAEIIKIVSPSYTGGNGFTYHVGHAHFLDFPFPLRQRKQLACLSLDIRDEFLKSTRYEVW